MERSTALNMVVEAGVELSKAKKMSTVQLLKKLESFKADFAKAETVADSTEQVEVVNDTETSEVETVVEAESTVTPSDSKDDVYVLGWKVENEAGESKMFVLKYGCMEFDGKPYCQKYVTPEQMMSKPEFFVRTYTKLETAETHRMKFLTLREKGAYYGLQVLTMKEVLSFVN